MPLFQISAYTGDIGGTSGIHRPHSQHNTQAYRLLGENRLKSPRPLRRSSMSWSKSLAQYTDIISHLSILKTTNARQAAFATPAEAQRWRARVYMYRTLLREEGDGTSTYDRWIFRITKSDPCVVQILDEYPENITFRTANGEPISLGDTPAILSEQEIAALRRQLGFDEPATKQREAANDAPPDSGVDTTDPFGFGKKSN